MYYNNERIGQTYEEVMEAAHAVEGEKVYELTDEMKEKFDGAFVVQMLSIAKELR